MSPPSDIPQPQPPDQVTAAERELPSNTADGQPTMAAASLRGTSKVNWAAVGLGLIPAILTAGFVAVMIFAFTGLGDRITSLEARMANIENRVTSLENRVTSLEDRMIALEDRMIAFERRVEARFAAQDVKIDALDAKMDEINLKLTALIAALGKTEEVDAAVEGELIQSG